jgi:hypothetical protein
MLEGISWMEYLTVLGSATLIYYIALFVRAGKFRFGKSGVTGASSRFLSTPETRTGHPGEPAARDRGREQSVEDSPGEEKKENLNDRLMPLVHDLVDEFKAFASATEPPVEKAELKVSIAAILRKYPALQSSTFFTAINNLIAVTSENDWSVHFSADELAALWEK